MFRLRSEKPDDGEKAENKEASHRPSFPQLLKKGSITRFMPSFGFKSSFTDDKKKPDPAANGGGSGLIEVDNSNFEVSNPAKTATSPNSLASKSSLQSMKQDSTRDSSLLTKKSSMNTSPDTTPVTGPATPMIGFASNGGSTRQMPAVSLDISGPPPALQNREEKSDLRPAAMSVGASIERYWHLGDVLEDKNISLSWRHRVLMALEIARSLKKLHMAGVVHGKLVIDSILVDQDVKCKIQNAGSMVKTSDSSLMQKDILFFGTVLIQLALHQTLEVGGSKVRRAPGEESNLAPGVPEDNFKNLKNIYSKSLQGEDLSELADSWEFGEALSAEVRALVGFHPSASENVPNDAVGSLEELAVQCCSAMAMNRPEADAVEDWLSAIIDMVGGPTITDDDKGAKEKTFWALEKNEDEILGDVALAEDADIVTGKAKEPKPEPEKKVDSDEDEKKDGYETDDSFMPPDNRERRMSRLSMFIEDATPKTTTTTLKSGDDEDDKKKSGKKKRAASRMSIKPSAMNVEKFAGMHRRQSSSAGMLITPAQCRARFDKQERLTREEIMALINKSEEILRAEPNLPVVQAPVTVVGDIHGQYFDLANMIDKAGAAGSIKYLFLGDYVDRGDWSCEVLFYILSMKCAFPQQVTMIRGNHECDAVSSYFGFKEEVESKYGRPIFYRCLTLFQCMPVGAVLDTGGAGRFLCVHGGISPHVTSLEQFETINRFQEPGMNGFLCDVLWSDPIKDDFDDGQHAKSLGDFLSIDFVSNPARGCSFRYGYSAIVKFLATNRLAAIIRAHEVMQEGFRYHFQTITGGGKGQARIMPPVITVFSAPNYLGTYGNQGAFLRVSSAKDRLSQGGGFKPIDLLEPIQFSAAPHPAPLVLESESLHQKTTIETACPYMPTTFDTFIARVLDFATGEDEDDGDLIGSDFPDPIEEEKAGFNMESLAKAPGMEQRRKESLEREAKELRQGLSQDVKVEMQGADLLKDGLLLTTNRRLSLVQLREKKGVSSLIAQFSKAAAADGINEMHPSLVQEKMSQAKKKLDSVAPRESISSSNTAFDDHPIMGGGGGGGRRTVVANKKQPLVAKDDGGRKSVAQKKGAAALRASVVNAQAAAAAKVGNGTHSPSIVKPTQPQTPREVEVDFSEQEIVALQMLYLMIDRDNIGTIRSKDLALWSAADGATISAEDADLCIEALDLDEDGGVGFSDYLAFAARLKLKHEKANGTLGGGKVPAF